jgi:2-haloacid dehalogenase
VETTNQGFAANKTTDGLAYAAAQFVARSVDCQQRCLLSCGDGSAGHSLSVQGGAGIAAQALLDERGLSVLVSAPRRQARCVATYSGSLEPRAWDLRRRGTPDGARQAKHRPQVRGGSTDSLSRRDGSLTGILFDAYGTLFDVYSLGWLAEELFPGDGAALATLWREKQVDYTRLRTLSDRYVDFLTVTEEALRFSCDRLRLVLSDGACRRLLGQYHRLTAYPEVLPALELLRARGFALAILSNGTPAMLESAISAAGMSGLFTHVLSADPVRKYKTAPEVYQLGVDAFDHPAEQLVFVSSNGWDACCAAGFGYQTLWINRIGGPVERLGILPTGQGRSMNDIFSFLGLDERPGGRG